MIFNQRKGAILTSFFFAFILLMPLSMLANNHADTWYRIGYEHSQAGRNAIAFEWMLKAAMANNAAAQNNIGLSYLYALGVEQDIDKAFYWFKKAAKQGLSYAQSELAMLYYQQGNQQMAQQWWLLAAKQNDEYAQFNLASLFLEQNNIQQAYYWFTQAKNNHHPDAQIALKKIREVYVQ